MSDRAPPACRELTLHLPSQANEAEADLINTATGNVSHHRAPDCGKFGSTTSARVDLNHPVEKGEACLLKVLLNRRNILDEYEAASDNPVGRPARVAPRAAV